MNKNKSIIFLIIFFLQSTIFSALPPLFEDIAEIKAILSDERLGQLLESGESIQQINKIKKGYSIITNKHKLIAKVIYKPIDRPGPEQFDIEFNVPRSLME